MLLPRSRLLVPSLVLLVALPGLADAAPQVQRDLAYATVGDTVLKLDLFGPADFMTMGSGGGAVASSWAARLTSGATPHGWRVP